MFLQTLGMVLQATSLIPMQFFVVLQHFLDELYLVDVAVDLLAQPVVRFLTGFEIVLLLFASGADVCVEVRYHLFDVKPHCVDVLVLDLDLLGDPLAQGGHILQHLAALLHADIEDLELLIHILVLLLDLSRQLLDLLLLLLEPLVDTGEDASLEHLGVVFYHERDLLDLLLVLALVELEPIDGAGVLEDAFLEGPQHLLDDLPHLGLHLEPLELLHLEFDVLRHLPQ